MGEDRIGRGRAEWWEWGWCKIDMGRGGHVWSSDLGWPLFGEVEIEGCDRVNRV